MIDQGLVHTPARVLCLFVVCMLTCLNGCTITGASDDSAAVPDRELAACVIQLQGDESPEQLNRLVQPGTVVVWLNKCGEDIRIVFPERRATIACLNPVSFKIGAQGIFESKLMPPGAVASLCFIQPGLYAYSIECLGDERCGREESALPEGTIVVK